MRNFIIKTAAWSTQLSSEHMQIGISRGSPRGRTAGYRKFGALAPGDWFNKSTPAQFLARYNAEVLGQLDPQETADKLMKLGDGRIPTLLCFEDPAKCSTGEVWCHRHLAGKWFEDRLGMVVEEVGLPNLDRFAKLRLEGIQPPSYRS